MDRRGFLLAGAAALAAPALTGGATGAADAQAKAGGGALPVPPLVDADGVQPLTLNARKGRHAFLDGLPGPTLGYEQQYLGPTLRLRRGRRANIELGNRTDAPVTAHWHGAFVPGAMDGGPHSPVAPGARAAVGFDVDQPAATLWYHSHVHGRTGTQVYHGLAGMLIVEDGAPPAGLPARYGHDDLPVIIQDRSFDSRGRLVYGSGGMALMTGFLGDTITVNGAIRPVARVPKGRVRLRLLNGSNARFYDLSLADGRRFYQVASDGGYLPAPVARQGLRLAPAERAEIVVDLADDTAPLALVAAPVENAPMGGMMGGAMMGGGAGAGGAGAGGGARATVLTLAPDPALVPVAGAMPARLPAPPMDFGEPVRRRDFRLTMHAGSMAGSMLRRLFGNAGSVMGLNGRSFAMDRIDAALRLGETELWRVSADMMAHPFHVHGTAFQVLRRNGRTVDPATEGLKDVVVVDGGGVEILVRLDRRADKASPFMMHCHILEHEDAGMMGQFTVG